MTIAYDIVNGVEVSSRALYNAFISTKSKAAIWIIKRECQHSLIHWSKFDWLTFAVIYFGANGSMCKQSIHWTQNFEMKKGKKF